VRFVAATTTTLTVAWNPPAQNGGSAVTEYHLFQGSSMIFSGLDLKYEVKSLSAGTSYTFTVVARNKVGDSPPSDPSVLHTDATQVTGN
jgi:chitinase